MSSKILRLLFILACTGSLFAEDAFVGNWTLDIARSKLAGPYAGMKAETLVIEEQGNQLLIVATVLMADGSSSSFHETVAKGGGPIVYAEGDLPAGVSRTAKRIDERNIELTTVRDGKAIQVAHNSLSKEGSCA